MGVVRSKAVEQIALAKDQITEIFKLVGKLDDLDIFGDLVLVACYIRPERTAGGLYLPSSAQDEDVWQGKVGLVLKLGPDAFRDPEDGSFYEQRLNVGEWGVFKVGDAWRLDVKGVPCRLVRDTSLRARVKDPSIVF